MATVLYQECYARAQELRARLDRMREWLDKNGSSAEDEELGWRRERFAAAQREYDELLQIIRSYAKTPAVGDARTVGRAENPGFTEDSE